MITASTVPSVQDTAVSDLGELTPQEKEEEADGETDTHNQLVYEKHPGRAETASENVKKVKEK